MNAKSKLRPIPRELRERFFIAGIVAWSKALELSLSGCHHSSVKILIATKNPGKFEEIREMLSPLGADFVSLADVGIREDFSEEGVSFEENALGKARFYFELLEAQARLNSTQSATNVAVITDDSGIFVEALGDELGIKTRRWGAGQAASDKEWLAHFMERMAKEKNRKAKFVCAAAFVDGVQEKVFLGETEGSITERVESPVKVGIPLSSVFKPLGQRKVFATLSAAEKNKLSHRGKAFAKLLKSQYA